MVIDKCGGVDVASISAVGGSSAIFLSRYNRDGDNVNVYFVVSRRSSGTSGNVFGKTFLGVNPNTIGGMYVNVFLLCVLGYAQWFWLVPRFLRSELRFQMLNLLGGKSDLKLSEAAAGNNAEFCDSQGRTLVERIIHEKDSEGKRTMR